MSITIDDSIFARDDNMIVEGTFPVAGGGDFKIEATGYDDPMIATVPGGKTWNIHVKVTIEESDA